MWWLRVGIFVGSVLLGGTLLEGCTRKREESNRPPEPPPQNPFPTTSGTYTPPRPRIGPPSDPSLSSGSVIPPVVPVSEDCDRFVRPMMSVTINSPRSELEILQNRVIPRLNTHAEESRVGNFSGVLRDTDLSAALASLEGMRIYLREGADLALDTESDMMNLNSALAYLHDLATIQPDPGNPYTGQIREAWDNNRVMIIFKGYNFQDSQVPHSVTSSSDLGGSFNRFRIITHQNYQNYPDMVRCVPNTESNNTNYSRAVSGYGFRGASRP
jgi:hypothetical protein